MVTFHPFFPNAHLHSLPPMCLRVPMFCPQSLPNLDPPMCRNPSPRYITLSYHRLSSLYYTCFSSMSRWSFIPLRGGKQRWKDVCTSKHQAPDNRFLYLFWKVYSKLLLTLCGERERDQRYPPHKGFLFMCNDQIQKMNPYYFPYLFN